MWTTPAGAVDQSIVINAVVVADGGGGPGPTMPPFPSYLWLGGECFNDGQVRCCSSSYGTVECECRFKSVIGKYIWVAK
jgi:hypothetical protein